MRGLIACCTGTVLCGYTCGSALAAMSGHSAALGGVAVASGVGAVLLAVEAAAKGLPRRSVPQAPGAGLHARRVAQPLPDGQLPYDPHTPAMQNRPQPGSLGEIRYTLPDPEPVAPSPSEVAQMESYRRPAEPPARDGDTHLMDAVDDGPPPAQGFEPVSGPWTPPAAPAAPAQDRAWPSTSAWFEQSMYATAQPATG